MTRPPHTKTDAAPPVSAASVWSGGTVAPGRASASLAFAARAVLPSPFVTGAVLAAPFAAGAVLAAGLRADLRVR